MKALKTVAVALGITLAALIVIPLAVLAGPVRLAQADRGGGRGDPRARPRGRLIDSPEPAASVAAGPRPTTHSGRPPIDRRASALSARRAAERRRAADRRIAEFGVLVVMVFWAGNFIVVKDAVDGPAAGRVHVPPLRSGRRSTLLALLRWREGAHPAAAAATGAASRCSASSGSGATRSCGPIALADDPGRRLGAAHRRDAGPHRGDRRRDRRRTRSPGRSSSGPSSRSPGVVVVIAAGAGFDFGGSPIGDLLTLARRAVLGDLHARSAAPVLRRHSPLRADDLGDGRRHGRSSRPVGLGQLSRRATGLDGRHRRVVLAIAYSGRCRGGPRQRRGLQRRSAARPDPGDRPAVARPGAGGRPRVDLPGRADPHRPRSSAARSSSPASRSRGSATPWPRGVGERVTRWPRCGRRRRAADPAPRAGEPPLAILVDYDGTVALTDVSDTVMAEHVPGVWEAEAAAYDAGLMGSRRLMTCEMALVDADPADAARDRRRAAARPGVRAVRPARPGGRDPDRSRLRRVRLLHRAGARGARGRGAARRHGPDHVRRPAGHRSPSRTATRRASYAGRASASGCSPTRRPAVPVVFIGDGESDRYAAGYSDVVFAKRSLVRICLEAGWPFQRWTEFSEIDAWLADTLAAWRADPATLPPPRTPPATSAAPRSGARASWTRRPGPGRRLARSSTARQIESLIEHGPLLR